MNLRLVVVTATLLGIAHAQAQNAAPPGDSGRPDACKLLLQSDLEALFPGMPITSNGPRLSPIYQGPQYNSSCMYKVMLSSPTSKSNIANFISLTIIDCEACYAKHIYRASESFAHILDGEGKVAVAANPSLHMQVGPLSELGDEALQETLNYEVKIYVRKDDLIFLVSVPKYSEQTQPNAVALARQVAKRWRGGIGMIEAATPIVANSSVDLPPDTRELATASADKWPDACALLTPEDVRAVFGDMTIGKQQKTMGKITYQSRIDRVETLPYPIGCHYDAHKVVMVNGQRQIITNLIDIAVQDVATSVDRAQKRYQTAVKADTPVPGVGDEASIDITNNIYVRKGVLTIAIHVGGDERDQALHDDARRRVNEIAKLVSAKLP
jgi:hypothetical protein